MKPARSLSETERAELAHKLAKMQAAVDRKATTRSLRAVAARPWCEDVTRDVKPVVDGRYSHVGDR